MRESKVTLALKETLSGMEMFAGIREAKVEGFWGTVADCPGARFEFLEETGGYSARLFEAGQPPPKYRSGVILLSTRIPAYLWPFEDHILWYWLRGKIKRGPLSSVPHPAIGSCFCYTVDEWILNRLSPPLVQQIGDLLEVQRGADGAGNITLRRGQCFFWVSRMPQKNIVRSLPASVRQLAALWTNVREVIR